MFHGNQSALGFSPTEWEVFSDLALDLDYYVADPDRRREDPSYYGDDRLEEEIRQAWSKLYIT